MLISTRRFRSSRPLVFNDIVLEECWDWTDVPGVFFTEPYINTVVRYDRPVTTFCVCGLTWPRRRDPPRDTKLRRRR